MSIAKEQLDTFWSKGFSRFSSFANSEEVDALIESLRTSLPIAEHRDMESIEIDRGQVSYVRGVQRFSPLIRSWLEGDRLRSLAQNLLGAPVRPFCVHFRAAVPSGSYQVFPHQDAKGPNFHPARAITFWLALGNYDVENGCLRYVEGSHLRQYQPDAWGSLPNPDYDLDSEVTAPTKKGDLLAHHCFTLHRSTQNQGTTERWALMFTYVQEDVSMMSDDDEKWVSQYLYPGSKRAQPRPFKTLMEP